MRHAGQRKTGTDLPAVKLAMYLSPWSSSNWICPKVYVVGFCERRGTTVESQCGAVGKWPRISTEAASHHCTRLWRVLGYTQSVVRLLNAYLLQQRLVLFGQLFSGLS